MAEPAWFSDYRGLLGYIGPRPAGRFPASPDGGSPFVLAMDEGD